MKKNGSRKANESVPKKTVRKMLIIPFCAVSYTHLFPSLVFGWLRARTEGVGASIAFHASCNLFSATLLQAYGPH